MSPATPLPKLQLGLLLFAQFTEPLAYTSIFPFINSALVRFGIASDPKSVGYYVGLIESLFFATEASVIARWGKASDQYGRKPILTIGSIGIAISMICLGLSTTLPTIIISRALSGLLNGNIGVVKAAMSELTDHTNRARAASLMPVAWCLGSVGGPIIGGWLSPATPDTTSNAFLNKFPYFLPCFVVALFPALNAIITVVAFKENKKTSVNYTSIPLADHDAEKEDERESPKDDVQEDLPMTTREILSLRKVRIAILNYATLALIDIMYWPCFNVFLYTPIESGGMGYSPAQIGTLNGVMGLFAGSLSFFLFPLLQEHVGLVKTFRFSTANYGTMIIFLPLMNMAVRSLGSSSHVLMYLLLGVYILVAVPATVAFGCSFNFVAASSPSSASFGILNGLAQTCASLVRTGGPFASTTLFALSIEKNLAGGYFYIYPMLFLVSLATAATFLLHEEEHKSYQDHDEPA